MRTSYAVGAAHVFASVSVGASQLGDVKIFIHRTLTAAGPAPLIARDLGAGGDLIGKLMLVETLATDVSGQTNTLRVLTHLTGGPEPKDIPAEEEASAPNGSKLFRIFVLFKAGV